MDAEVLFRSLPFVAAPLLKDQYRQDSCLASTRITCAVCRYYGIDAKPVEVDVDVWNREAEIAYEHDVEPDWAKGAWHVGTRRNLPGDPQSKRSWPGSHLVAESIEGGRAWIVDLSSRQFNRPAKGIVVPDALVVDTAVGWKAAQFDRDDTGTVLTYRRLNPPVTPFRGSPDWKQEWRWKPIVGEIIRNLNTAEG